MGIPSMTLQMIANKGTDNEPVSVEALHENSSFIKVEEGYPNFFKHSESTDKKHNCILFSPDSSPIGILDFYESLSIIPKICVAINVSLEEAVKVLKPDNGYLLSCLEKTFLEYSNALLDKIDLETGLSDQI